MMKLIATAGCMLISLALCAFFVFVLDDASTLVPPPEQVAECFFKQLKVSRYSRAFALLDSQLTKQIDSANLEHFKQELELKIGKLEDVSRKEAKMSGDWAHAVTKLKGESGSINVQTELKREEGVWKVSKVFPIL